MSIGDAFDRPRYANIGLPASCDHDLPLDRRCHSSGRRMDHRPGGVVKERQSHVIDRRLQRRGWPWLSTKPGGRGKSHGGRSAARLGAGICILASMLMMTVGHAAAATPLPVVATAGLTPSVFVSGGTRASHPTALASLGSLIYVGYANATLGDGSDGGTSTVIVYTSAGKVSQIFSVKGSISSLRADQSTNVVYAMLNRLGNSALATITPERKTLTEQALPANPPHGGGFADILSLGGRLYISASNPVLTDNGTNMAPAVDRLSGIGAAITVTPLLAGNAKATDVTTHQPLTLNEVDPTTLASDPGGNLVLNDQAGSELIFIHQPASQHPQVSSLLTGTQLVQVTWADAGKGRLLVADTAANVVYAIGGTFSGKVVFGVSAADSGVSGLLGTVNLASGAMTPVAFGFKDPSALLFTR